MSLASSVTQYCTLDSDHTFFFAHFGSALVGIYRLDSAFDFFPKTRPADLQPFVAVEVGVEGFNFHGEDNSVSELKAPLNRMLFTAQPTKQPAITASEDFRIFGNPDVSVLS